MKRPDNQKRAKSTTRRQLTLEQISAQTFDGWASPRDAIGNRQEWMDRASNGFPTIALAMAVLAKSDAELTTAVLEGSPEIWFGLFDDIVVQERPMPGWSGFSRARPSGSWSPWPDTPRQLKLGSLKGNRWGRRRVITPHCSTCPGFGRGFSFAASKRDQGHEHVTGPSGSEESFSAEIERDQGACFSNCHLFVHRQGVVAGPG